MKGKLGAVTQVSLALLLALSLGFMTAGPSMAQEPPQESASISRETAEYNLDDPQDFISTRITSGVEAITDGGGYELQQGRDDDYMVLGKTLLILNHYLKWKLTNDRESRESVVLTIQFDVGLNATFTIKAIRTQPTIDPEVAFYELVDRDDVKTTITWHEAEEVVSIFDDDGDHLQEDGDYTIEVVTKSTTAALTILNEPYLARELENDEDHVVLTIQFDFGDDAIFNITAIKNPPSIFPKEAEYDLDKPADVLTTITWGTDNNRISSIVDGDEYELASVENADYTVTDIDNDTATLTISEPYLNGKLEDIEECVVLTIAFDVGDDATFIITAIGTHPTIDPKDAIYDVLRPAPLNTTITWRDANDVVSIADDEDELGPDDYSVTPIDEEKATLTINDSFLSGTLKDWRDEVVLTIEFDFGSNRTFTITAIDTHPTIDPPEAEYDLNGPADVTTTITWQDPTAVVSIVDDENELQERAHYEVTPNGDGTATLEIVHLSYLRSKMTKIGDEVELTVAFSVGDDRTLAITAVRYPRIDPHDFHYEWDEPPDFVEIGITWGSVSAIDRITDNEGYVLGRGQYKDYIVLGNTLVILNKYLRDKLSDLQPVTLIIAFDVGDPVDFTITVKGTHPNISPRTAPYARDEPHDVTTSITWGSASNITEVTDEEGTLERGLDYDYSVPPVDDDKATLTINKSYLTKKLADIGESVVLTIAFDVGNDRAFTITTGCFIATAAYGTPMAEQIQILREFRDEYLLTNPLGQAFVDFYYRTSPPIAEFINEYPSLKPVVRAGLLPAVVMSAMVVNTTPAEKTAILGLLVLVSVAVAVWATRQRGRGPQYS